MDVFLPLRAIKQGLEAKKSRKKDEPDAREAAGRKAGLKQAKRAVKTTFIDG